MLLLAIAAQVKLCCSLTQKRICLLARLSVLTEGLGAVILRPMLYRQ